MNINYSTRQLIRSCSKGYLSTEFNPTLFSNKKINFKNKFPYSIKNSKVTESQHATTPLSNQIASLFPSIHPSKTHILAF